MISLNIVDSKIITKFEALENNKIFEITVVKGLQLILNECEINAILEAKFYVNTNL